MADGVADPPSKAAAEAPDLYTELAKKCEEGGFIGKWASAKLSLRGRSKAWDATRFSTVPGRAEIFIAQITCIGGR